ncbi:TM0106 family RecB-like putative nuclease [Nitrospira sp. KM1]|uniref:TM0106 family RecB-like putative nuclease n=1 Tax=Nitrospira sp. KM1 TaxID=1936990 RepID=UPI001567299F|nr:TM0106 family RecB-like putative nuclease [Nitrospira sp. KM1]
MTDKTAVFAATDLSNFLACRHRSALDLAAAMGKLKAPAALLDMALTLLREKGAAHERAYVEHLRAQGLTVVEIPVDAAPDERVSQTVVALKSGADVICQGAFAGQGWIGYADVLRKEPCPPGRRSSLGDFYYEPYDTKLARETRGGTILQLALYADLLGEIQGVAPERFFVVTPGKDFIVQPYRLADYAAYFRMVRARMLKVLGKGPDVLLTETYPDPVEHCDVCRWWERCNKRRRDDDHLSFIAGVGLSQRTELVSRGVTTLAAAAVMPVPVTFKPSRGTADTYNRIVEQAQVQLEQRTKKEPIFKVLPVVPAQGLCRLPEPSPGDLFLDLEGARFVREGGHEYLFGLGHVTATGDFEYRRWWAMDTMEEQAAFEALIDAIQHARTVDPHLHIYHFAPYEPTALKRLAGRYAIKQDALDDLLRGECFVDLYAAVRQAVRAGVESYSIKELEQYFGYQRVIALRDAATHRIAIEIALEIGDPDTISEETRQIVEEYNRDDVVSTWRLREWLEGLRTRQIEDGVEVLRPTTKEAEKKDPDDRTARAEALRAELLDGLSPEAATDPHHPDHPRWLLAFLIDWHHREEKANWWEYFRLKDLPEEDLIDEPKALTGLQHVVEVGPFLGKKGKPTGSIIHRYRFPLQEVELTEGDTLKRLDGQAFGEVLKLDRTALTIDVKRGRNSGKDHPRSVFSNDVFGMERQQESVMRFAANLHAAGYQQLSAGADLLYRRPPRLRKGEFNPRLNESAADFAVRIVTELDRTTLAIQGPPGAGKTYAGARMIRTAVGAGMRVGVTANSHKVIQNLLAEIEKQGRNEGKELRLGHKVDDEGNLADGVTPFKDNGSAIAAITSREIEVLGGTAWLWASEHATQSVDLLFVDEAGQFSLANTLAVASAAMSVVVFGDPQQLDQPQKASHPEGVGVSALAHVLGGSETMPTDRGIFMPETWRLAPAVCSFTSELFYAGKLKPLPSLAVQRLTGTAVFDGAGLWWIAVAHDGNRSSSDEEVRAVAELVDQLIGARWVDQDGKTCPFIAADLRVVAPYNAQVNRLAARLQPRGVPVGTVDKFQGQTCAAVIYSMATSSPEDAPRGMEFLYSLNRLNVATSRGRCATFIVASPALLDPQCWTPRQMQLANGLCRFVEMARRP